jgi:hypothetical protein
MNSWFFLQGSNNQSPLLSPILSAESFSKWVLYMCWGFISNYFNTEGLYKSTIPMDKYQTVDRANIFERVQLKMMIIQSLVDYLFTWPENYPE